MNAVQQLPLDLPTGTTYSRDDLIVTGINRDAVSFFDSWPHWPTSLVVLAGPTGSGKSHLAHIWAEASGAQIIGAARPGVEPRQACILMEDVGPEGVDETRLFHLVNHCRAAQGALVLTSRTWPFAWNIALPDLLSRLKAAHFVEMPEPDDELLTGVMTKLFTDRQMNVDPSVLNFLVVRMERSLASAADVVASLDRLSLAEKRAVTKPLAARALQLAGLEL